MVVVWIVILKFGVNQYIQVVLIGVFLFDMVVLVDVLMLVELVVIVLQSEVVDLMNVGWWSVQWVIVVEEKGIEELK